MYALPGYLALAINLHFAGTSRPAPESSSYPFLRNTHSTPHEGWAFNGEHGAFQQPQSDADSQTHPDSIRKCGADRGPH